MRALRRALRKALGVQSHALEGLVKTILNLKQDELF